MARQLRVEYSGAIYHVTVRSNGGEGLFLNDVDRKYLLSRLAEAVKGYRVRIYLYCLMDTHFHLVVETPGGNLRRFMQGVLTGYSVYFNRAHQRHGHVTQGRYGAKLVAGDPYLLSLSRYVHLNPVKIAAMVAKPLTERVSHLRKYPWSSYPAYLGKGTDNEFVEYGPMLALMEGRKGEREERYREYVERAIAADDEAFGVEMGKSARCIGSDTFREWVDGCYRRQVAEHKVPEDVSFRRGVARVAPETILAAVAKRGKVERTALLRRQRDCRWRAVAGRLLCLYGGLTQREAAVVLGLGTGVAVSCQMKRLKQLMAIEPRFRRQVEMLGHTLEKVHG